MKLLLDTCCIIWAVSSPTLLSRTVTSLLEAEDSVVSVSPISSAEIACAVSRGRIKLNRHWKIWFRHYIELNKWDLIDIDLDIMEEAYSLPEFSHNDPVDRIITATARLNNCTLMTADKKLLDYPHVTTVW